MKKQFNKELVMIKNNFEDFQNSTKWWICDNDYIDGDVNVRGAVASWLSLLQIFIQQSLTSDSAQIQILLAARWRFAMVRISGNGPDSK